MSTRSKSSKPRRPAWGRFVRESRIAAGIRSYRLASASHVEASYISLIECDGYVPSREIVLRIATALSVNRDIALAHAGYLPESMLDVASVEI